MNPVWSDFLASQGMNPGDADSTADCGLSALSDQGFIRIEGEDARDFLQGQLTNDVKLVSSESGQLSGYCNPKGRLYASFLLFEHAGELYMQLPLERLPAILKRLSMFVLMSKVKLTDASADLFSIGLSGDCVDSLLDEVPAGDFATLQTARGTLLRMPGDLPRVQVISNRDQMHKNWQDFASMATPVNPDFWPLQNIRSGYPQVLDATSEAFVPQMLNMQLLDGVSFTKGCYTGQEVVARMKYLGQLKRRMYRARIETDNPVKAGDLLYSASSQSGQGPGRIVDARLSPDGGYEALVMAQISSVDTGDLQLGDENGPSLQIQDPPYGFSEE